MLHRNSVIDKNRSFEFFIDSFSRSNFIGSRKLTIPFKPNRNKNISLPEPASISEKKKGFNEKVDYVVFKITDFVLLLSLLLKCSFRHMFICNFLYLLLKCCAESSSDRSIYRKFLDAPPN